MAAYVGALCPCVYILAALAISNGFNLDPRFSVIKRGPDGSYFGFSVAEHQIVSESVDGKPEDLPVQENVLLIGAPKANSEVLLQVERSGAIYKCPADSTLEDDCEQLKDAPFNSLPDKEENMTDQWLGVVVQSQGKGRNVLTCAHRYMRSNYGLGMCYTLLQSLDYQEKWRPCLGRPVEQLHRQFGVCQAGVSGMLLKDDGFIMGAPGSFDWRGVMFKGNMSEVLGADKSFYYTPVPTEGNSPSPTEPKPPVDKYAYLGYSVTSGVYDKSKQKYYIAGAPRSGQTGEIVIFSQIPGRNLLYAENQIIKGQKDFSSFGHDLLTINLNNDQYDDLIVGAPFYHDTNVGGAIYIYLGGGTALNKYTDPIVILSRQMNDQECRELQCEHARFGFSLSKAGDLNGDGYQDFAVGAPYEGNGTVYIFHGSKKGVVEKYAQRIPAEDVPSPNLESFGHSLSGGMDLDGNGYPDLLVGSYESNEVSLIRARPIIHLISNVTLAPEMIDLSQPPSCQFERDVQKHCVQISICLSFKAEPQKSFTNRPRIVYKIETEKSRSISRVLLKNPSEANGRIKEAILTLRQQTDPRPRCTKEIAYLEDSFQDKLNPLIFDISYKLEERPYTRPTPGQPLLNINDYPILATAGAEMETTKTALTTMVEFVKDCEGECNSNLQFEVNLDLPMDSSGRYVLSQGDQDVITLTMTVRNVEEAAYLTRVYIKKPETLHYQGRDTLDATNKDTDVKCDTLKTNASLIECSDIGNPLPKDNFVSFMVKLDPSKLQPSQEDHQLIIWANTSSTETTPENDLYTMSFRVIIIAEMTVNGVSSPDDPIIFSGNVRGESAIKIEDEIGPPINHTFVVTNFGPGVVSRSELTIYWPYQTENGEPQGKHLLYLMQAPQVMNGPAECIITPEIINPLEIKVNPDFNIRQPSRNSRTAAIPAPAPSPDAAPSRRRRASTGAVRAKRNDNRRDVVLDCRRKTAKCHQIKCNIGEMSRNAYVEIKIRARLWESTLLQDYMNVGEVKIRSKAELYIDPALNIESKETTNENYATTIAIPDVKEQKTVGLEWWIIVVAVLAGIILLAGLILLLWKLGFFKRKKPEDMVTYQGEVKKQKDMDEEEQ
ncbi:integrin alpha-PS1-like isoform X1 [Haliotis asinina]|uniref:integrin alpha-PS1-like isoform X1 n=1 Tax=Haliotis asinina TaxID=109174 RepID=UPI0035325165